MFLLRLVIPPPLLEARPRASFVLLWTLGYPVAAVGVNHPSLLSGGRVFLLGVTIGTQQAREQEVLFPFVG